MNDQQQTAQRNQRISSLLAAPREIPGQSSLGENSNSSADLLEKIKNFLPKIAAANKDLEQELAQSNDPEQMRKEKYEIECVSETEEEETVEDTDGSNENDSDDSDESEETETEEDSGKVYVEMNLGVGVFDVKKGPIEEIESEEVESAETDTVE